MRESMARLTPRFSAERTVREYTEQHYLPAAHTYNLRKADKGKMGKQVIDWRRNLQQKWQSIHFGEVKIETRNGQHSFEVQVYLNDLDPGAVRVEVFANGGADGRPVREQMKRIRELAGASGLYLYSGTVPGDRPAADYTPRIIPYYDGVAVPLEDERIVWQR
jgi:starch phosphorylase